MPPIDSCKRWPTAINPQPTTTPAENSGASAVGPDRVGARPCFPIGNGLIALDQSSEPARKTRTGRFPSRPRERPGGAVTDRPARVNGGPATPLGRRDPATGRAGVPARPRAAPRAGSSCGTNPGPCKGELRTPRRATVLSPLWFGAGPWPRPERCPMEAPESDLIPLVLVGCRASGPRVIPHATGGETCNPFFSFRSPHLSLSYTRTP